jgi:hypothetical protein
MKTFVSKAHFVTYRDTRKSEYGFREIGLYVDPVLTGAHPILIAVITHPAKGAKWFVHGFGSNGKTAFKKLSEARKYAFNLCVKSDVGQIHVASPEYSEIFTDLN